MKRSHKEETAKAKVLPLGDALPRMLALNSRRSTDQTAAMLAAIVSSTDDAVISKTLDGIITTWNPAAERIYGYSAAEAIGQSIALIVPPQRRDEQTMILDRIRRGERVDHYETVRITRDGRLIDMSLTISPLFDRAGRIIGASKIGRDITLRRRTEAEVRATQEMLRLIVDNLPPLISYIDCDYRYQLNNRAYETWFGKPYQSLAGHHAADVLGTEAWRKLRPYMDAALAGETVSWEDEIPYQHGGTRWVNATYIPHKDAAGAVRGFAVLVHDVDARRREEEAQRFLIALHDATRGLQSPADVMLEIVTRVGQHFSVIRCAYGEIDEPQQTVRITRGYTVGVQTVAGVHPLPRFGTGLADWLRQGRTAVIDDVRSDPRTAEPAVLATYDAMSVRSLLIAPIVKNGSTVAMLAIADREPRQWHPHDARLLEQVAERTFFAVESARSAASLRESRDVLSIAMRAGKMGAWSRDLASSTVWWSPELEEMFGLAPGSLGGSLDRFLDLVHPEDRLAVTQAMADAIDERREYTIEFRVRHADGDWRWIEGRGRPIYEAGRPMVLYGLGIDISERKRAEEVLRRQAAIFENQSDAIIVTDLDGLIVDCNPACERMLGATKSEIVGQPAQAFDQRGHEPMPTPGARTAFERDGIWSGETAFVRRDGSTGASETVVKQLVDNRGQVVGTVRVSRDISERLSTEAELRRLNRELSEADQRKNEFLAVLAHELRNPLAPISNAVQYLRVKSPPEPAQRNARDLIDRQVRHLVRLVDDLLDVSRISRGKINLQKQHVDLSLIISSALEASRPAIESNAHELSVTLPDEPVYLDADITRLAQVVQNLLNNAAKYTPPGGKVALRVEASRGWVTIRVTDNGMGIPSEMLPRIFEMFMQVDRSLERTSGGLGIGLTLVQRLVELHSGRVEAISDGLGRGAEFVVRLPRAPSPTAIEGNHDAQSIMKKTHARRILVADDNVDAADSLAIMLKVAGHLVHTVYDGLAATRAVRDFAPDTVLLDIGMPKLNGYQAAQEIRRRYPDRGLLLVAITGWGQDEDRRRSRDAGFDHHLVKPVDPRALAELLAVGEPAT
jgi:PAS domain S-box-containing protein